MRAIGFLGLGAMGSAIASNLLQQGIDVVVWNRSQERVAPLVALGARAAESVEEALRQPVSISMLANDAAVDQVLSVDAMAAAAGCVHLCTASISPQASDRLEQTCRDLGVSYVAAPVLGRPEVAARGDLNVVAAGPADVIDRVQPLLDVIGRRTWRVGEVPRTANVVKVAVNYNIIHALHALGESVALVERHGGSAAEFTELLSSTMFGGVVHQVYGRIIAERSYWPAGFTLELGLKDLELAAVTAQEAGVELPSVPVLRSVFADALRDVVPPGADWSAIAEVTRTPPEGP